MLGFRGASPLCRARLPARLRDGVRGAPARARGDGPDQRADDGAVRAHAGAGAAGDRPAGGARPEARRERAASIIMMCEVPTQRGAGGAVPRVLRRHVDRLQRPDAADAGAGSGFGDASPKLFDERDPAVKALIAMAIEACRQAGQVHRHLRPGAERPSRLRAVAGASRGSVDLAQPGLGGADLEAAGGEERAVGRDAGRGVG